MLVWQSKSKNPPVSGMTVFGSGYWFDCGCLALLCVSLCTLFPYENHAQLGGGSDAERLMSTLAYGWVERCNDIVSCRTTQLQDKCSLVFSVLILQCICLMNYYEHVECLNECICFHCIFICYTSAYVLLPSMHLCLCSRG